ncbi:MAG: Glutamyl-tRNA reductase [Methanomassiliicoccales archaeon PtaB.Bin134]|nr:MAG: Glutamyl-tRNA reductase [Methanomassiliicoccales archaeon PtaB.Bin134]
MTCPLLSAHITHKDSCIQDLGRLGQMDAAAILQEMRDRPGVEECAVLKTCNRVEFYLVSREREAAREGLEGLVASLLPYEAQGSLVRYMAGKETLHHLLRVASGLESMIVGEDQIQSQVKEAFELSCREGCCGPLMGEVFRKALNTGKRVRTETRVNKGNVSIGSAAVDLAESRMGDLKGKTVLVVGAGQMASLIAKHLAGKGPEAVFVSNRTYARAVELAWSLDGKAVRFEHLHDYLVKADVVLCATSATHNILGLKEISPAMERRSGRGMFIIDVSFPRNVDQAVRSIPGVQLCDLSALNEVARENLERRRMEVFNAERVVKDELDLLSRRLDEMRAAEILRLVYIKYEGMKAREVGKALNRLKAGESAEEVLEALASSLMSRFLADPTAAVKIASRQGDGGLLRSTKEIFALEVVQDVPAGKDEKA